MRATPRRFPALGWRGRHGEADGVLRGYGEAPVGGKCDGDLDSGGGSTAAEMGARVRVLRAGKKERVRVGSGGRRAATSSSSGRGGPAARRKHGHGVAPVLSTVATGKMAFLPKTPRLHFL